MTTPSFPKGMHILLTKQKMHYIYIRECIPFIHIEKYSTFDSSSSQKYRETFCQFLSYKKKKRKFQAPQLFWLEFRLWETNFASILFLLIQKNNDIMHKSCSWERTPYNPCTVSVDPYFDIGLSIRFHGHHLSPRSTLVSKDPNQFE